MRLKFNNFSWSFIVLSSIVLVCSCSYQVSSEYYDVNTYPNLIQHPHHQQPLNYAEKRHASPIVEPSEEEEEEETETEYFDLSYTFDNNTIYYPGQRFDFHLLKDVGPTLNETSIGNYRYSYASWSMCLSEHGGTHMDAPFHFNRFGWKVAEIPLKRLVDVPLTIIDVEHLVFALKHPDEFVLEVEHILDHEARFGKIPPGSVVLVRYGWSRFWPDPQTYMGWDNSTIGYDGQPFTLHFPGMKGNAASFLVRERKVYGLGDDTMSPDVGDIQGNPVVHVIALENQVYLLENVANLDYLLRKTRPQKYHQSNRNCRDLRLFVLPLKTLGTGGPTRLLAYCKNW